MECSKTIQNKKIEIKESIIMRLLRFEKEQDVDKLEELLIDETIMKVDDNTLKIKTSNQKLLNYMMIYLTLIICNHYTGTKTYQSELNLDDSRDYEYFRITEVFYNSKNDFLGYGETYMCNIDYVDMENKTIILKYI